MNPSGIGGLLSFLLLLDLAGFGYCTCAALECEPSQQWTNAVVGEEEEALQMLQVRSSKQTPSKACPYPAHLDFEIFGKGCPDPGTTPDGHTCLKGNQAYETLHAAWEACGKEPECGAVMEYFDHKFYLRRTTDPNLGPGEGAYLLRYECTQEEQARLVEEEEQRKAAEAEEIRRQEMEGEMQAKLHEVENAKAAQLKAWNDYVHGGGLNNFDNGFADFFDKFEDRDCGWSDERSCNLENQAYILNGTRHLPDVPHDQALTICGEICESAGLDCGGFSYKYWSKSCFFRKNSRCGISIQAGTHCYVKKVSRHESARAQLEEMEGVHGNETITEPLYDVTEDSDCGWSDLDTSCNMDNQAWVNSGARSAELISRDEAVLLCGTICESAGMQCGGFVWKAESQSCFFRKNSSCGMSPKNGTVCYSKKSMKNAPQGPAAVQAQPEQVEVATTAEANGQAINIVDGAVTVIAGDTSAPSAAAGNEPAPPDSNLPSTATTADAVVPAITGAEASGQEDGVVTVIAGGATAPIAAAGNEPAPADASLPSTATSADAVAPAITGGEASGQTVKVVDGVVTVITGGAPSPIATAVNEPASPDASLPSIVTAADAVAPATTGAEANGQAVKIVDGVVTVITDGASAPIAAAGNEPAPPGASAPIAAAGNEPAPPDANLQSPATVADAVAPASTVDTAVLATTSDASALAATADAAVDATTADTNLPPLTGLFPASATSPANTAEAASTVPAIISDASTLVATADAAADATLQDATVPATIEPLTTADASSLSTAADVTQATAASAPIPTVDANITIAVEDANVSETFW